MGQSLDWLFEKDRSLEMEKIIGLYCQDSHCHEAYLFRACLGPQNGIA